MVGCPTLDEWAALASGEVTDAELDQLVTHLDSCLSCESLLKRWKPPRSPLLLGLASVALLEDPLVDRLCDRLVAADVTDAGGNASSVRVAAGPTPRSFGAYELRELLGRGGMGEVYKAWHKHLHRWVAIKFVALHRRSDDDFRRRFAREMAVIGAIDSPHVVRAFDAGVHNEQQYLVMEFVQGHDLGQILKSHPQLSIADACDIARQASLGLAAVAARGLMHRDIKPSNLFLCDDGVVKLLDLGLARRIEIEGDESQLTSTLQVLGTPDYVSPEQVCQQDADIRADLYSLGCTLYQMLAGRAPFASPVCRTFAEKLLAHRDTTPPALRALRPEVTPELEKLVGRLMAKRPDDRPAAPAAVAQALLPFAAGAKLETLFQPGVADLVRATSDAVPLALSSHQPRPMRYAIAALSASIALAFIGIVAYVAASLGDIRLTGASHASISSGSDKAAYLTIDDTSSGSSSIPAGELPEELVWFDTLGMNPKEFFWPHGVGASDWDFDPKTKVVKVSAADQGAIILGRAKQPYYRLRMTFSQNRWPGGVGLFFGLHEVPDALIPTHRCQTIMFNKSSNKPMNIVLERATMTIRLDDKGRNLQSGPPIEVDRPLPRGTQQLEVEVRENRVTAVRLDGDPIDEFIVAKFDRQVTTEDHQGEFGIWAHGADGTISDAFLMLLPAEAR